MKREHARKLLALARANRDVACAVVERTRERLREARKITELLHVQEVVALARERDAYQRIGALRAALTRLGIPEISLSDNEDDVDGGGESENSSEETDVVCVAALLQDDED
jgi:hypothetical protein